MSTSTAKPAAGVAKLAKTHTARASLVPAAGSEASPERSGAPSEAAWDGPVDLWVDDVEGDWDTQLPWSVRPSDS